MLQYVPISVVHISRKSQKLALPEIRDKMAVTYANYVINASKYSME